VVKKMSSNNKKNSNNKNHIVRKLRSDEKLPYNLLLLADETKEAINKYIKDSDIYVFENKTGKSGKNEIISRKIKSIGNKNEISRSETEKIRGEKETIGIYVLQYIDKDTIEIKNIAVVEKFRGQGIGTFLLKDAEIRAKERGFKTIIIGTGDCGIKQIQLYQKVGFEIFDVKKNFLIDNYPEPIHENGVLCKDMVMLQKQL
jgi:N-acetylglutamate synthase-like GNAT family acetyltransferase